MRTCRRIALGRRILVRVLVIVLELVLVLVLDLVLSSKILLLGTSF